MPKRRPKPSAKKKRPARSVRKARRAQPAAPLLDGVAQEPAGRDPSAEELRQLEVSVERDQLRERLMGQARAYPRTDRDLIEPLTAALAVVPGVKRVQARLVAQVLKAISDPAHDLDDIIRRILNDKLAPHETAELVLAFQILIEEICTYADGVGEKLYEVFDQAKGLK